jgi:hypothetical protein
MLDFSGMNLPVKRSKGIAVGCGGLPLQDRHALIVLQHHTRRQKLKPALNRVLAELHLNPLSHSKP